MAALSIALFSPLIKPGAVKTNTATIIQAIEKNKKADLCVFPRLAVTGCTCGSMYEFPVLLDAALAAVRKIAATGRNVIVGLPKKIGNDVFDCTAVITEGNIKYVCLKKGITETGNNALRYGGDEYTFDIKNNRITLSGELKISNEITVVPAAYPSFVGSKAKMLNAALRESVGGNLFVCSAGNGESVSGKIMSGDKIACAYGKLLNYADFYEDGFVEKCVKKRPPVLVPLLKENARMFPSTDSECAEAYSIMGRGIVSRMREIGTDKVIFGLSGGLDSTNVLIASALAFDRVKIPRSNIICVTMRGHSSSSRTQDNAKKLIDAMRLTHIDVPIAGAVDLHLRNINHTAKDVVYENAQARERTQVLLDLSNKFNALMLGTGDLSETCLGWSTFGGDQLSQYNPNCSLTKTAIRALCDYYVRTRKEGWKTVEDILATPVSPELLHNQETETIIGPYVVHDFFFECIVLDRLSPENTIKRAQAKFSQYKDKITDYYKIFIGRFFKYQFKRNFGPDGVQLFPYDLGDLTIRSDFSEELWKI